MPCGVLGASEVPDVVHRVANHAANMQLSTSRGYCCAMFVLGISQPVATRVCLSLVTLACCRSLLLSQKEKKSLLKLLSSNKKKSRPSPPSSPTLEAEHAAAGEVLHGAVGPDASPPTGCLEPEPASAAVVASASSSSGSSSSAPEFSHRKGSPLDGCVPIAPPPRQPCSSLQSQQHDARPIICERYAD